MAQTHYLPILLDLPTRYSYHGSWAGITSYFGRDELAKLDYCGLDITVAIIDASYYER